MKPTARLPFFAPLRPAQARPFLSTRTIHTNPAKPANVVPVYGTGPPPDPPAPVDARHVDPRIARRRKQAEMLRQAKEIRAEEKSSQNSAPKGLKKRFWAHSSVKEVDGALEVHLDTRALKHPTTKSVVRLPLSKPHLAAALALEWDLLTSAAQALKQHLVPMTSLVCRALDIRADDSTADGGSIRKNITNVVLRYLDTDSLLCLAPPPDLDNPVLQSSILNDAGESLREVQERAAVETIAFLTAHVWPGVEIEPVLDGESILPKAQKPGVREIVQGWVMDLDHFELAALERATLGAKSLLCAARLVAEWSEGRHGVGKKVSPEARFGVEEAAKAASIEVDWQTGRWGEVEDTHDVEKEDLRRQLGSAILLTSGTKAH